MKMNLEHDIENEIGIKELKLREFMLAKKYDLIMFFRRDMFSWITGGRDNHIIRSTENGFGVLAFTIDAKYCIANQVEKRRLQEEELYALNYEFLHVNWWEEDYVDCLRRKFGNIRIGADAGIAGADNIYEELKVLRYSLLPEEVSRYRELTKTCTIAVEETCREICQGQTEREICANLVNKAMNDGIEASVALVASDERIFKYRHPIDTVKKVEKYAMVVLCGQKYGLYANLTRFIHFGLPGEELHDKFAAVRAIDAEYMTHTVVGASVSEIFRKCTGLYDEYGYKDEWKLLHQGGPTGYSTREFLAGPDTSTVVCENQAFTWNPSITGTKSEDTIIVNSKGFEILTRSGNWPEQQITARNGMIVNRPDILIR